MCFFLGTQSGGCPIGWRSNGNYCYYISAGVVYTYNEALSACLAENATLTSVENIQEQDFLNGEYRNGAAFRLRVMFISRITPVVVKGVITITPAQGRNVKVYNFLILLKKHIPQHQI